MNCSAKRRNIPDGKNLLENLRDDVTETQTED
jgi:hypothetical protein